MWQLLKDTVIAFINDEALSRGAAIAFYTVTSIAPLLLIVIAIAGLVFGEDAAQGAITAPHGTTDRRGIAKRDRTVLRPSAPMRPGCAPAWSRSQAASARRNCSQGLFPSG
jgi:membrane protein